jgi:hypothetical protein
MGRKKRPLSEAGKEEAFRVAIKVCPNWYTGKIARGMRDVELTAVLEQVLGIFGSSCGPGRRDVTYQASGLKIWAGWHIVNHVAENRSFRVDILWPWHCWFIISTPRKISN